MNIHMRSRSFLFILLLLSALNLSVIALGKAVNGTLLGTVTDPTGATIAGTRVSAVSAGTGAVHAAVTNESGNYSFPDLQPDTYSVSAEAKGV
jgi:hypothetical protein